MQLKGIISFKIDEDLIEYNRPIMRENIKIIHEAMEEMLSVSNSVCMYDFLVDLNSSFKIKGGVYDPKRPRNVDAI